MPVEAVPLADLPHGLARVAAVLPQRDRPERVGRLDHVAPFGPGALPGARDDAQEQREREGDDDDPTEHAFAW